MQADRFWQISTAKVGIGTRVLTTREEGVNEPGDFLDGRLPFQNMIILHIFSLGKNSMVYTDCTVSFKNW